MPLTDCFTPTGSSEGNLKQHTALQKLLLYRGGHNSLYRVAISRFTEWLYRAVICVKLSYGEIMEHVEISLGIDRSIKEVWTQYKATYCHSV